MCERCNDERCNDPDSKWCSDILLMRYKASELEGRAKIAEQLIEIARLNTTLRDVWKAAEAKSNWPGAAFGAAVALLGVLMVVALFSLVVVVV